jgi:Predicted nucleic acid-binding protein, contains PIN domain
MPAALVDSNVLIDFRNEDSRRHDSARQIVAGIDSGSLPTGRVVGYVVLETLNLLHARYRPDLAVGTRRRLSESAGFEIVHTTQSDFARAVDIHEKYEQLSFGDAAIAAHGQRGNSEYLYSFDDDFDQIDWVTRLASARNPFEA